MITIGGKTIYHAGDTCLFGDMELIARRHPVDIAILPIGGHYTMDRHDAAFAAGLIGAGTVIPCHYNTFPPIETDAEAFKADVEDSELVGGRDPRAGRGARRVGLVGPGPQAASSDRRNRGSSRRLAARRMASGAVRA